MSNTKQNDQEVQEMMNQLNLKESYGLKIYQENLKYLLENQKELELQKAQIEQKRNEAYAQKLFDIHLYVGLYYGLIALVVTTLINPIFWGFVYLEMYWPAQKTTSTNAFVMYVLPMMLVVFSIIWAFVKLHKKINKISK